MINLIANQELKNMGCKWSGQDWIAPELGKDKAQEIKDRFYSDLITIDVQICLPEFIEGGFLGAAHVRTIGGYVLAAAYGRDSGARIADGVVFLQGKMVSGGSMKNYRCLFSGSPVIRMKVSKNALNLLDFEVEKGLYTYSIIEDLNKSNNALEKFTIDELQSEIERRKEAIK